RLGAAPAVVPLAGDPAAAIRELLPAGADYVFEAIGKPEVAAQAFAATATGGVTVLIGQPPVGVKAAFPVYDLTQFEHTILGTHIGGANPTLDIPTPASPLAPGKLGLAPPFTPSFPPS